MTDVESASHTQISRRTVMKGVAWSVPAIAAVSVVPIAAASTRECLPVVNATGGTYPIGSRLSGCQKAESHWDFQFKIKAAQADCGCDNMRVKFYDNPKRSRLWWTNDGLIPNPALNTSDSPLLYVQQEMLAGEEATFPREGQEVRVVPTGAGLGMLIGKIGKPGSDNDSLHTLINPDGGDLPCDATGPMATYQMECEKDGVWSPWGALGSIDLCVPMISVTVCRIRNAGIRVAISVSVACGIAASNFTVTNIQNNTQADFPNRGRSVWTGSKQLSDTTTNIVTGKGPDDHLWVSFTTGDGNTSQVHVYVGDLEVCDE